MAETSGIDSLEDLQQAGGESPDRDSHGFMPRSLFLEPQHKSTSLDITIAIFL